jgi:hypothetical protein
MTVKLLNMCFLLLICLDINAQNSSKITGIVRDTAANLPLHNASIVILNKADSTFATFVRADANGIFLIKSVSDGDYILIASYPGYAQAISLITIDSLQKTPVYRQISLLPLPKLLKEVVVTARKKIVIRGDTLEYDATAYSIHPNAKVEEIIKQLPGIQVDKDGKITAQGQRVKKVLLDGEEFFGDDPTLVTRNIRGDMVDKIQIYDKKSDQASLADNNAGTKTIDIKLKEDSKKGVFGNANAGAATQQRFQANAMLNKFDGSEKFAFYSSAGNTGVTPPEGTSFNSSSNANFLSPSSTVFGSYQLDDFKYNGQGKPLAFSAGAHYDNRWKSSRDGLNVNYKYGLLDVNGTASNIIQYNLPTQINVTTINEIFNTKSFGHKIDSKFETKLDSNTTLVWYLNGGLQRSRSFRNYNGSTLSNQSDVVLNKAKRLVDDNADFSLFETNLIITRKLKKSGRSLSLAIHEKTYKDDRISLLKAENDYFGAEGRLDSSILIDQRKNINKTYQALTTNLVYTDPLNPNTFLSLNYNLTYAKGKSDYKSFNPSANGQYNSIDSLYSGAFDLRQMTNLAGIQINFRRKKHSFGGGTELMLVNFDQLDNLRNSKYNRHFLNFNPRLNWSYNFSPQTSVRMHYAGDAILPTIDQLQPFKINTDPLNIFNGNIGLNPAFRHTIDGMFNLYNTLTGRSFIVSATHSITAKDITSSIITNGSGQSEYQFINLTNKISTKSSGYIYWGEKIKGINLPVGAYITGNTARYYSYINSEINQARVSTVSIYINTSKTVAKKYSFNLEGGPSYTANISSTNTELSNKGWGINALLSYLKYLPAKIQFNTDINYSYLPATTIFNNNFSRVIWNVSMHKSFFKKENLQLGFLISDLLNQNKGFTRDVALNTVYQREFNTIRRYFMISLKYDLNQISGH